MVKISIMEALKETGIVGTDAIAILEELIEELKE
jgi:hypothetical protein